MKSLLLVMAGGGVGAGLRYGLGRLLSSYAISAWPWATFAVNIIGGLAMGLLMGWLAVRSHGDGDLRLLLGVGLLGGFTTFSAFSLELANMIERGDIITAGGYAFASVILALAALFGGLWLARTFLV